MTYLLQGIYAISIRTAAQAVHHIFLKLDPGHWTVTSMSEVLWFTQLWNCQVWAQVYVIENGPENPCRDQRGLVFLLSLSQASCNWLLFHGISFESIAIAAQLLSCLDYTQLFYQSAWQKCQCHGIFHIKWWIGRVQDLQSQPKVEDLMKFSSKTPKPKLLKSLWKMSSKFWEVNWCLFQLRSIV